MSKYINIVILYQSHFHKGSETNISARDTLCKNKTFEMGLPGFKGQGQAKVKNQNSS